MQARCAANRVAADPGDIALSKYLTCTPVHDLVAASVRRTGHSVTKPLSRRSAWECDTAERVPTAHSVCRFFEDRQFLRHLGAIRADNSGTRL